MSTCVVKDCPSKNYTGSALIFYSLPEDSAHRVTWLKSIQFKGSLWFGATVCSLHFRPEDYVDRLWLHPDAVPRLHTVDEMKMCLDEADLDITNVSKVCRICMEADRKTFDLASGLLQAYSQLVGVAVSPADALPRRLCWECAARVRAAARLRARALRAQDQLTQLLLSHGELTMTGIHCIDRRQNKLTSELTQHCTKYYDYEDEYRDEDAAKVENGDINGCVDGTPDDDGDLDVKDEVDSMYEDEVFQVVGSIETDLTTEVEGREDRIALDVSVMGANEVDSDETEDNNVIHKDIIKVIEVKDIIGDKKQDIAKETVKTVRKETVQEKCPVVMQFFPRQRITRKDLEDFTITKVTLEEEIAEVQKRKQSSRYQDAPYKCDICYRGYYDRPKFVEHLLKHSEKHGKFECVVCKTRFQTSTKMSRHVKEFHNKKYTCKKCPFVTKSTTSVNYHVQYHSGITYTCPHCSKVFNRKTSYYGHLRIKHSSDVVCELCGHTFRNSRGVYAHKLKAHKLDDKTLAGPHCEDCDVTFASEGAHARHLLTSSRHSLGGDHAPAPAPRPRPAAPVTCELCDATLPSVCAYAGHHRARHPGEPRARPLRRAVRYMCEQCGLKFQSITALRDHKNVHTGLRNFKCSVCDKAFATQKRLSVHSRLHSDTPPSYACLVCDRTFRCYSNRERHKLTHSAARPFECEACGARAASKERLWQHIAHVHNKKPWPRRRRAPEH